MPHTLEAFPAAGALAPAHAIGGIAANAVWQEKEHWCWAAVCSACSQVVSTKHRTIREIVATASGRSPQDDLPDAELDLLSALVSARLSFSSIEGPPPNEDQVVDAIQHDHPVAIAIRWSDGSGHAVCAYGYERQGGTTYLMIYDPLRTDETGDFLRTVPISTMAQYGESGSAGKWGAWVQAFGVTGDAN